MHLAAYSRRLPGRVSPDHLAGASHNLVDLVSGGFSELDGDVGGQPISWCRARVPRPLALPLVAGD